jgi:FixJ family two-component response regulator
MTRTATCSSLREGNASSKEIVYIVDDDATVVDALSSLLRANGKQVQVFTSGQDFLDFERQDSCACLILDLRMPGLNGLEVQESIAAQMIIPVIFITGRGDVPSTVTAMKGGAVDFFTKPIDESSLLASIDKALEQHRRLRLAAFEQESLLTRYRLLTPREQQVLPLLVSGLSNKRAAGKLGITEYTVQIHRGHIMRKMEADSFATLVKLAGKLNLESSEASQVARNDFLTDRTRGAEVSMGMPARTIAVIDDDGRVLESLINLLASFGYKAEGYGSAEEFLESGGLQKSSCVITDVEMGQMSGLGLLQHINSAASSMPVVIITGKPSEKSESFYLEKGAVGFFRKPVDGDALVDLLKEVCKG